MKLADLFEGPFLIGQEYTPKIKMDSYPSLAGLKREFQHLASMEKEGQHFEFWLTQNREFAKVSIASSDPSSPNLPDRQKIVTTLRFKKESNLPVPKELQVDVVYSQPDFKNQFLAGALYILLARYGFSVVSDFSQYLGGQALWKKIAAMSEGRNYSVFIWSDENGDWLRDDAGEPIKYNAANVGDDEIWQDISQHHLSTTLFCLQHGSTLKTL